MVMPQCMPTLPEGVTVRGSGLIAHSLSLKAFARSVVRLFGCSFGWFRDSTVDKLVNYSAESYRQTAEHRKHEHRTLRGSEKAGRKPENSWCLLAPARRYRVISMSPLIRRTPTANISMKPTGGIMIRLVSNAFAAKEQPKW